MKKILILEDDHELATLFSLSLEREGYLVSSVQSIPDAKEWLQTKSFDLLIIQGAMPDVGWWQFYKELKRDTIFGSLSILVLLYKLTDVYERANQIEQIQGKIKNNKDEIMIKFPIGSNLIDTVKRILGDSGQELPLGSK